MEYIFKAKEIFFRSFLPFLMPVRDVLVRARLIKHEGRQQFPLGYLAPGVTVADLVTHLKGQRFVGESLAWVDEGQIYSLKLRDDKYQYHVRIFDDGEVRGHYELSVERYPIAHLMEEVWEARAEKFAQFCGTLITPEPIREK